MLNSVDIYLGAFLILCGFLLSLLNLRRVLKNNKFSSVLLSENILLLCVGLTFLIRSVYNLNIENMHMKDLQGRTFNIVSVNHENNNMQCTIWSVILSYSPLIISFVNSFVSLVIDNYLHYEMLKEAKEKDEENTVQEITDRSVRETLFKTTKCFLFWKKYFSYIMIGLQWITPLILSLFMLPVTVNEKSFKMVELTSDKCMAMISSHNETCVSQHNNFTDSFMEFKNYFKPTSAYLEVNDNIFNINKSAEISTVVSNLYKIINNVQNASYPFETTQILSRQPKLTLPCMMICYVENNGLIMYMFVFAIVSYFVPITLSTIILTKIHNMKVNQQGIKTYISRELLYNILFWSPVMLDTFISLVFCSYSMFGMKTSFLNIAANVYQTVKNFMNTKYFKDNTVFPV